MHARARLPGLALGLLCASTASLTVRAEAPSLVLEHLTTTDGLPEGSVLAILQDSQGFMWFGTEDGLVRYDGHDLVRYDYSPDAHSGLPGTFLYQIVEDARHDLWIAIKGAGVARWNRATDDFTLYRHDPKDPHSLASDAVRTLSIDPRGRVWIGTSDAGIDVLDPIANRIEHFRHDPSDSRSLSSDAVLSLARDEAGVLWVGTDSGLDELEPGKPGFRHFRHSAGDPRSLSGNLISQILEEPDGTIWVGTGDGGLDRMDREGHILQVFRHDARRPGSLASDDVRALLVDRAGHFWVGTADGLDLVDRATGEIVHYRHDPTDPESLRDSFIMSLYQDATGLVWIGTHDAGVSHWNPRSSELGAHRPAWLAGRFITAFADAPGNQVWIASMGGGVTEYDTDSGRARDLTAILGRRTVIDNGRIMSLMTDRHGALWIGTMGSGVAELDPRGHLTSIPVKRGDPRAVSAPGIATLYETRSDQVWIGTYGGGVNVLDPATGLVRQLPYGSTPGAISSPKVIAIAEDSHGYLWIGTDGGGLDLARPDGTVVKVFRHDPKNPASLPVNAVYGLAVDAQDRVWIGTAGGGLALATGSAAAPETIHFRTFTRKEGVSSDTIYGVLVDAGGRIWLSGNAGLMRFDPRDDSVKTFHREDGLQGEEFNSGAYFRLRDGRLCFGGTGGFNIFDPSHLAESSPPPPLALTRVEILGAPAPGRTPYWLRSRIPLDYRDSIVSLDIGVLDFTSPKHNRLAYRMSGLTDHWIDLGTQHRITLTNLEAGDHVLEVRGANSDSVWSKPLTILIHRAPAPWRSSWAYALYALAAFGLLAYVVLRRRRELQRVLRERERLEAEVAARTSELTESNRQLADAARAKSDFLDRMSHELRTPMNGVVGMTELLARTGLSPSQSRLTQTIRSSADVLLQIVNDLLDLSKVQAGKVVLEKLPLDLGRIMRECADLLSAAADAKRIELVVRPPAHCPLLGDPLRVRQILMNLIGNAVKFTERGKVTVRADIESIDGSRAEVLLAVTDTGIGMDAATIGRIFEPFTQADESTSRRFGGSGLGLAICRELTELMGGRITVESAPRAGSTFRVYLPLEIASAAEGSDGIPFRAACIEPIGGHVLLVEDDPVNAAVAQGYLDALGCTTVWTKDGAEAIARSAAERFDVILMDLSMPGFDGFATTQLIRERAGEGRLVPVVALTAHDAGQYRERCLAAGMSDVLSKPYTLDDCERILRRWVPRSSPTASPARSVAPERATTIAQSAAPTRTGAGRSAEAAIPELRHDEERPPGREMIGVSPEPADSLSKVDVKAVARLRGLKSQGQTDLYSKLVELFRAGSSADLGRLGTAIGDGDLESARTICHKLKSSAANVGAMAFSHDVRRLEQLCSAGDRTGAQNQYERLQAAHPALIRELMELRLRESA